MQYYTYHAEWQRALEHEIASLKQNGGTPILATRGRFLYGEGDTYVYHFRLHGYHTLQEGSQVRLVIDEKSIDGEVLFATSYDVELSLTEDIGEEIPRCHLYNEPWELLQGLIDRLEEIEEEDNKKDRVMHLLSGTSKERHFRNENKELSEIVARALYNQTTYIWGPPGTGKSYTLTEIILAHYLKGQRVLVLAHSNAAVDVLMKNVSHLLETRDEWIPGEVIRYGSTTDEHIHAHPNLLLTNYIVEDHPALLQQMHRIEELKEKIRKLLKKGKAPKTALRKLPQLEEQGSKLRMKMRKVEGDLLNEAQIIGCTLSKCIIDRTLYEQTFDLVVVDEISMAYTPQLAFASSLGERTVVCGDFMQLPPIASSRSALVEKWLKKDLFVHVHLVEKIQKGIMPSNVAILNQQWRMHPKISGFTNHYVYLDEVSDHKSVKSRQQIADGLPFQEEAAIFLNTGDFYSVALRDGQSQSRYNVHHALLIVQGMLHALKQKQSDIGVVTPYRAQARFIQSLIDELLRHHPYYNEKTVVANTIHKFQGSERDVIFFDTVDSFPQHDIGGMYRKKESLNLINVAMTRSRGKFIEVGNKGFLREKTTARQPIAALTSYLINKGYETKNGDFQAYLFGAPLSKRLQWFEGIPQQYKQDILEATETVEISCTALDKIKSNIKEPIRQNSKLLFTAYVETGKHKTIVNKRLDLSFCIIDERILWLGIENHETYSVRLQAPKTIALLKTFLGIATH